MITAKEEMNSIQRSAKVAGVLYLLIAVVAGFVHFYVPGKLIVPGDAATTASNIMASQGLFRISMAAELVVLLSEIVLSVLLYVLLKPVNKTLSLVAAVSRLVMTAVHGVNLLNHFIVVLLVSGARYLSVFQPDQLQALVTLFLNSYSYGYTIGIVFFTLHTFILAYLIFKSGYFPKLLGILFMIAAFGYLLDSFSHVLIPGYKTGPVYLALPIAIAEIAFPLWLLIKGVNVDQWNKRALEPAPVAPLPIA
jgi:hypothetical protein